MKHERAGRIFTIAAYILWVAAVAANLMLIAKRLEII
jgi:hypothetical protein